MIVTTAFNPISLKPRPHALGVALAAKTKGDHFVSGYYDDAGLIPRRLVPPARPARFTLSKEMAKDMALGAMAGMLAAGAGMGVVLTR